MTVPMQLCLDTVRKVFAGEISRHQLARMSAREQVYVGHAIIWIFRDRYLYSHNQVRGIYGHVLYDLLSAGTIDFLSDEKGHRSGSDLVGASKRAGLYASTPGQGGIKPIILTLPPELMTLVEELGHTPAIDAFLEAAAYGVEQDKLWRQEYEERMQLWRRQQHMQSVISRTEEEYGRSGLLELREALQHRLGSADQ